MLFSRLSILSGDGCDWWLHVKVVCGRYASFCGNMGFGGGEGGNIAWIFPEQSQFIEAFRAKITEIY